MMVDAAAPTVVFSERPSPEAQHHAVGTRSRQLSLVEGDQQENGTSFDGLRNADILQAIQALGQRMEQESKAADDRCNSLQDALNTGPTGLRASQQLTDLDVKVQQLLNDTQECSSKVEEHEVRLGVTRSKIEAHDQRIALLSDRLDRILRTDKNLRTNSYLSMTGESMVQDPTDIADLRQRVIECEKRLGCVTGSAASTPRGRHSSSRDGRHGVKSMHMATASGAADHEEGMGQAADQQQHHQPATVALRLAKCEQTATALRCEFAEHSAELTQRVQASFQDLRGHLDALGGQMLSIGDRVARCEDLHNRVDGVEVRMGDSEQFAGSLHQGLAVLQKLLGEVKRAMDVAITDRQERLKNSIAVAPTNGAAPEGEVAISGVVQRRLDELAIKVGSLPSRLMVLEERTGRAEQGAVHAAERARECQSELTEVRAQSSSSAAELGNHRQAWERVNVATAELREALQQQQLELARLAGFIHSEQPHPQQQQQQQQQQSHPSSMAPTGSGNQMILSREDGAEAAGGGRWVSVAGTADAEAGGGTGLHASVLQPRVVALPRLQTATTSSQRQTPSTHDVGVAEAAGGFRAEDIAGRGWELAGEVSGGVPRRRSDGAEASGESTSSAASSRTGGVEASGSGAVGIFSVAENGPETSAGIPRRGGAEAGGGPSPSMASESIIIGGSVVQQPPMGGGGAASGASSPRLYALREQREQLN